MFRDKQKNVASCSFKRPTPLSLHSTKNNLGLYSSGQRLIQFGQSGRYCVFPPIPSRFLSFLVCCNIQKRHLRLVQTRNHLQNSDLEPWLLSNSWLVSMVAYQKRGPHSWPKTLRNTTSELLYSPINSVKIYFVRGHHPEIEH